MDVCMNVSVSSECQQEELSTLDDLFPSHNTEVDFGMEWLSVFVEDCFSSKPSCLLAAAPSGVVQTTNTTKPSNTTMQKNNRSCLQNFAVPGKARSKRKRLSAPRRIKDNTLSTTTTWSQQSDCSDPPLLKQAYWLADSELINVPKKNKDNNEQKGVVVKGKESLLGDNICDDEVVETTNNSNNSGDEEEGEQNHMIPRRCTHCMAQRTPQWRGGPMGPKTLCNACGVRYKSGRLLPEYRPAKSPTFVTYLHSNSHKKVLEMRNMATTVLPSPSSSSSSNIIPTDEK